MKTPSSWALILKSKGFHAHLNIPQNEQIRGQLSDYEMSLWTWTNQRSVLPWRVCSYVGLWPISFCSILQNTCNQLKIINRVKRSAPGPIRQYYLCCSDGTKQMCRYKSRSLQGIHTQSWRASTPLETRRTLGHVKVSLEGTSSVPGTSPYCRIWLPIQTCSMLWNHLNH